jgi:phosphate-selective porin OprO and OprP
MSGRQYRVCLFGAVLASLLAGPVWADEGTPASSDGSVARLESLLEAQQKKIDVLEQQVATAQSADMDSARIEQMKQQIREVLSEQEFRESLMPSTVQAGYDNGFFIKSSDDKFQIKFNGQFQFRYTYYGTRQENRYLSPGLRRHDRSGFDIARARLRLSGHAYSKDLTYLIEFDSSSPADLDTTLLYGWVNYRVIDEFQIKAGVFLTATTRANIGSTAAMQFVDYPIANGVFGLSRALGVRMWGKLFKGRGIYYLDIMNALNGPTRETITTDETQNADGHDNNPGIAFRTVWNIITGSCAYPADEGDFVDPCDYAIHTSPAWNVGFHYAYTEDWHKGTLRIPFPRRTFFRDGGFGLTSSQGLQVHQFGFDTGFKIQGFSLTGEYVLRLLDVRDADHAPYTPLFLLTGDDSTNAQHGGYVQAGYLLPIPGFERKIEVVGRVGGVSALSGGQEGTWDYGGGINYYIEGHRVKLQMDITKVSEAAFSNATYSLANVNDDALIWRVQLQVAF